MVFLTQIIERNARIPPDLRHGNAVFCLLQKTICASVNFVFFIEFSSARNRAHYWKIPVENGLIWREQVSHNDCCLRLGFSPGRHSL
jgi:hypothetical protein